MEDVKELKRKIFRFRIIGITIGIVIGMSILIPMYIGRIMDKGGLHPDFLMFIESAFIMSIIVIVAYQKARIALIQDVLIQIEEIEMLNEIKSILGTGEKEVKYLYGIDCLAKKILDIIGKDLELQYFVSMNTDSTVNIKVKERKTQRTIYNENIKDIQLVMEILK